MSGEHSDIATPLRVLKRYEYTTEKQNMLIDLQTPYDNTHFYWNYRNKTKGTNVFTVVL